MSEYTAEQLKAWAEDCEGVGFCESAEQYRSHAAALERIAELEADLEKMTRQRNQAMKVARETQTELFKYRDAGDGVYMETLRAEHARLRKHAEAMAGEIADFCGDHPTHAAYRAEFKEVK